MSDASPSLASLSHKIASANDLQAVVRAMKAMAAASVGQYEKSVLALGDYYRTVELGLGVCFRESKGPVPGTAAKMQADQGEIGAIVFGSDQGLVGRFNDIVADYAIGTLAKLSGKKLVFAVGERVHARLKDAGLSMMGVLPVPNSVEGVAPLVGKLQVISETQRAKGDYTRVYVFHNQPQAGAQFAPVAQRLLPLDTQWQQDLRLIQWPTGNRPEVLGAVAPAVGALVREFLFISLFKACAESLASENASRLAAMERADKNIKTLLTDLHGASHRLRQDSIDEELFDVVSGFDAMVADK